ncbi:MAG: AAA family ATPase [Planctomycetes bacterium]|nr:AAA family ATPase [Planctomycetota bacterium]
MVGLSDNAWSGDLEGLLRELGFSIDEKYHERNEVRVDCPWCAGTNFDVADEPPQYPSHCKNCGKGTHLRDAARELHGRDRGNELLALVGLLSERGPERNSSPACRDLGDLDPIERAARAKGVVGGRPALERYGAMIDGATCRVPMHRLTSRRTFEVCGWVDILGKKYTPGSKHGFHIPHDELGRPMLPTPGETWCVVEGVKDAATLHALGYPTLGLASASLANDLKPQLHDLLRGVHVVAVPDLDHAGWQGALQRCELLQGVAASVKVVRLPGEMRPSKGDDVRDVYRERGEELLRRELDHPREFIEEDWKISRSHAVGTTHIEEAWKPLPRKWLVETPPPQRYLLHHPNDDGFLPASRAGMLCSAGGVGKTYLVLQLAVAVATGTRWLEYFNVGDNVPAGVLLCLGEEDAEEVWRRLYRVCERFGLDETARNLVAENVVVLPLSGRSTPLLQLDRDQVTTTNEYAVLQRLLNEHAPADGFETRRLRGWGLVVLDPLSRFAGVDAEMDNRLATRFVQACEELTEVPGRPTVIVPAHSSKLARRMGTTDSRGVTALGDGFRFQVNLTRDPKFRDRVTLEAVKGNYAPDADPVVLRRRDYGILTVEDPLEAELRELESEEAAEVRDDQKTRKRGEKLDRIRTKVVEAVKGKPGMGTRELKGYLRLEKEVHARDTLLDQAIADAVAMNQIACRKEGPAKLYFPESPDHEAELDS